MHNFEGYIYIYIYIYTCILLDFNFYCDICIPFQKWVIEIATSGVNDMQIFRLVDYLTKSAVLKGGKSILNKQFTVTLLTNKKINKYSAKAQKVPISLHVLGLNYLDLGVISTPK